MQTIDCTRCRSSFDVSQMEPGTRFLCGECGAYLQVPLKTPETAVSVSRTPTVELERARRGRDRRPPPRPVRRGRKAPIVFGGVAALAVAVLVAVVAIPSGGKRATPEVSTQDPTRELTVADRMRELRLRIIGASDDLGELQDLCLEAEKLGAKDLMSLAAKFAEKQRGDLEWTNQALGRVRFIGSGLPDEFEVKFPTDDWDLLLTLRRKEWITPEEAESVTAAKRRFLAHRRKLGEDPHYRRVCEAMRFARRHPVLRGFTYETMEQRPFLVFLEKAIDRKKSDEVRKVAERHARMFDCLYGAFMERFGEALELEKLESESYSRDVVLRCFVFANRRSFDGYVASVTGATPSTYGAFYNYADQWMTVPAAATGVRGRTVRGQEMDSNAFFREGTRQLVHHITRRILDERTVGVVTFRDRRLSSRAIWFREGLAAWFGAARPEGESWKLFQRNHVGLSLWSQVRRRNLDEWSLTALLSVRSDSGLKVDGKTHMEPLFHAQAWALVKFLWEFEDGKYRKKFLEYAKAELRGESGLTSFTKIFEMKTPAGTPFELEYRTFCDRLLSGF
jgi:hypothetical protein